MRKGKPPLGELAGNGETTLIRRIARAASAGMRFPDAEIHLGIGDDAALLSPKPGHHLIVTCDWFLEATHFLPEKHPPGSVGWKCLARAVSDVAAMGGIPRYFLLSLALPASRAGRWFDEFLRGLRRASRAFRCQLVGGDTTRRSQILINVTVIGEVPVHQAILRSGARPGDLIYVSGRLGEAEFGLRRLRKYKGSFNPKDPQLRKHLYPEPRLPLGRWLAKKKLATAMMDLSDGLSSDLPRLCEASGVGARIEASKVPVARFLERGQRQNHNALELALNGGDDYELLFTVSPRKAQSVPGSFQGVSLAVIGRIARERKVLLVEKGGRERRLIPWGWDPFRQPS